MLTRRNDGSLRCVGSFMRIKRLTTFKTARWGREFDKLMKKKWKNGYDPSQLWLCKRLTYNACLDRM